MSGRWPVLFVQGAGDINAPDGSLHLARYLAAELGPRFDVRAPEMPGADTDPRFGPWRNRIVDELGTMASEPVLVGHSLGGSVLLKYLADDTSAAHPRAIFVVEAPWWGAEGWDYAEFALPTEFASRLPKVPVFLYHSVADPEVPISHLEIYASQLPAAKVRRLPGDDHSYVGGLPELVADIRAVTDG